MNKYFPFILRFIVVAIVIGVGRELEIDKQIGGVFTAIIYLVGIVWIFRGKRVFTYRFGQNIWESKKPNNNVEEVKVNSNKKTTDNSGLSLMKVLEIIFWVLITIMFVMIFTE